MDEDTPWLLAVCFSHKPEAREMETSCGYDGDMTGCRYTVVVASSLSAPIPPSVLSLCQKRDQIVQEGTPCDGHWPHLCSGHRLLIRSFQDWA